MLKQLAQFDLRGPLGPAGLAEPDLPARQRAGSGVHLHAPGSAGELLYVSARCNSHDVTAHRITDGSVHGSTGFSSKTVGGAGGARIHDRRIMRSTASCTTHASCTDDTRYRTDGARRSGII